jgi:hypothetical protein
VRYKTELQLKQKPNFTHPFMGTDDQLSALLSQEAGEIRYRFDLFAGVGGRTGYNSKAIMEQV